MRLMLSSHVPFRRERQVRHVARLWCRNGTQSLGILQGSFWLGSAQTATYIRNLNGDYVPQHICLLSVSVSKMASEDLSLTDFGMTEAEFDGIYQEFFGA